MDDLNRREAMGVMAAGVMAITGGTNPQTRIALSKYKKSSPLPRAINHLLELGFTAQQIELLERCCDHIDRVKIKILGMKNRFPVEGRDFDADVAFVKECHGQFEDACKNIVWMRDNGKPETNQMVWLAVCMGNLSRNMDVIAWINGEFWS